MNKVAQNPYEDIISLPHPEPRHHPRMSMAARAAQFSPFAALSGYEDIIDGETQTYETENA